jgi:redox-sensitive bicupin YhaK (pirin superfamily)
MPIAQFLKPHEKDLGGGFVVRRLLPAGVKQAVGPFIFFDHFGPLDVPADANHDVRQHPHIGLATVTYLFEGAMEHKDSVGSVQRIEPGAINWMTAGSGIVHSERTPGDMVGKPRRSHGLQLWAALPREFEEVAPSFAHTPSEDIPVEANEGGEVRVLIGSAFGHTSPVATFSQTLYLDVTLEEGAVFSFDDLPEEAAVYPVQGEIDVDGQALPDHTMALLSGASVHVKASSAARFVVIGGAKLDGHRFMWWNFVSSSKDRLMQAADKWDKQQYDMVAGETDWIPAPPRTR